MAFSNSISSTKSQQRTLPIGRRSLASVRTFFDLSLDAEEMSWAFPPISCICTWAGSGSKKTRFRFRFRDCRGAGWFRDDGHVWSVHEDIEDIMDTARHSFFSAEMRALMPIGGV